ncbi:HlyC/CorC family transporter [bacterium]|nr:HlyC/CorC family transporter [bacterium]
MDEIGRLIYSIAIIGFLLLMNGFFVAAEISIISVRRTRLEQLMNEGNLSASLAMDAIKEVNKFVAAVQLGVTIASIGLGWVGEATIAKLINPLFDFLPAVWQAGATHSISTAIAFVLITVMHVVIGELVPKSIALQYPEQTSLIVAWPMKVVFKVFAPFVYILNGIGNGILRLIGIKVQNTTPLAHSVEELDMIVNASYDEGVLNETEKDMLHNVFKFSDLQAKQVMIPRTDVVSIPSDITFEELTKITSEAQYTRYPVYENTLDNVIGIIHIKDIYSLLQKHEQFALKKILRPVMLVPETMTMDKLVLEFKKSHGQLAIVVDEFGGTSGIISLEDVLEEIFGEVQDEFDEEEADIKKIAEDTYSVNAMLRLDELAEYFQEEPIEDDDVDTIGGLVVKNLGRIAQVGDTTVINDMTCRVEEVDGARVTKLLIEKEPKTEESEVN